MPMKHTSSMATTDAVDPYAVPEEVDPYAETAGNYDAPANNTEGLYEMKGPKGTLHVPYSRVMEASKGGYTVEPHIREKYAADRTAEMKKNPKLTESDLMAMELPQVEPQAPGMWQRLEGGVQKVTTPTNLFPGIPTNLVDPALGEMTVNTVKRIGAGLFGAVDFIPQAYGAYSDATSSDPQRASDGEGRLLDMHPATQIANRRKEVRDDWRVDPKLAVSNLIGDAGAIWASDKIGEYGFGKARGIRESLTEKFPMKKMNRLLKPAAADLKFGKDPARAMLEEGIVGDDLRGLGDKVYDKLHEIGAQIDQQAKLPVNKNKIIDVSSSLKPIDEALLEARKNGEPELYKKLLSLRREVTYEWKPFKDAKGEVTLRPVRLRNLRMSPEDALNFKRMVGDKVRWTGNDPFQDVVNEAAGSVYGSVKDLLNTAIPGLKDLNTRYSNLVGAAKAIERHVPVENRNATWSLKDVIFGVSGHIPLAVASHVLSSPKVMTRVAQTLYNMGRPHDIRPGVLPSKAGTPPPAPTKPMPLLMRAVPPVVTAAGMGHQLPLPQAKTEAQQRNPAPKKYKETFHSKDGHRIGTDDRVHFFDLETGQQVK
jgi:hypothetical protein